MTSASTDIAASGRRARRIPGIEGLRGLLAFSVLAFHYFYYGPAIGEIAAEPTGSWLAFGRFAVMSFFVISGYVIAFSSESGLWQKFAVSRLSRLLPAALVCASLTYFAALGADAPLPVDAWLGSATLVPLLVTHELIDPSYWSIEVELAFYILVALLLLAGRRAWMFETVTAMSVGGFALAALASDPGLLRPLLFPYASFFALGIGLYRFHAAGAKRWLVPLMALNLVLAAFGAHLNFVNVDMLDGVRSGIGTAFGVAVLAFALVAIAEALPVPAALEGLCSWLGGISYPLYLLHGTLGYLLINAVAPVLGVSVAQWAVVAAMLLASTLVYRFVERPAVPFLRTLLASLTGLIATPKAQARMSRGGSETSAPGAEHRAAELARGDAPSARIERGTNR